MTDKTDSKEREALLELIDALGGEAQSCVAQAVQMTKEQP